MVLGAFVKLPIVGPHAHSGGSSPQAHSGGSRLSHEETRGAMRSIFPLLILQHQSSIDTLLYLPLDLLHMVTISPTGKGLVHIPNRKGATIAPNWAPFFSDMHNKHTHTHALEMRARHANNSYQCMTRLIVTGTEHCYAAWVWSCTNLVHSACTTAPRNGLFTLPGGGGGLW